MKKESYENQKKCRICGKDFFTDKNNNLNKSKKSEIMIIIQKNIEELVIVIAIYAKKHQERFL